MADKDYLRICIADAIIELLKTKPLNKITADEISEKSGVGRATFFRYFSDKEEPIRFKIHKLWEEYSNRKNMIVKDSFYLPNAKDFFAFHIEVRPLIEMLYTSGNKKIVLDALLEYAENVSEKDKYKEKFLLYGLFGITDACISSGYEKSVDEMVDFMYGLTSKINVEK
ncbi:MAG: TetR/AcrR family transcriptional regulator [Treponema sp.]|uniref:TetR/AcrR family transcriptional regulator n=1 Tax=Treponema sp. TaxID=166 RepID=UPI00298E0A5A|nr:TetR/AcrR family transcriptional regulator [Treponema sp.]MCQ2602097.1 TetR/AcrR family transcriptional regulator [Treponema sp.]